MIVARICDSSGKPLVNTGSLRISPYDGKADGWFPVDGFNFGFQDKGKDGGGGPGGGAPGAPHGAPAKGGAPAHGGGGPGGGGAGGRGGKGGGDDFAELSLEKQVDTASTSLMYLAMKERKSKKGTSRDSETKLEADIHVISSVVMGNSDRATFTSLMIHLEAVNVLSWDIRGSGDSRPTETVKLRYDRAAMIYIATPDGKYFNVEPPKGWDQTANDEFSWNTSKMKRYFPPGFG